MPLILDDIDPDSIKKITKDFTPKSFHSVLTGSGGKVGVLNRDVNAFSAISDSHSAHLARLDIERKTSQHDDKDSVREIPISIFHPASLRMNGAQITVPDPSDLFVVELDGRSEEVWVDIQVQWIAVYSHTSTDSNGRNSTTHTVYPKYRLTAFVVVDPDQPTATLAPRDTTSLRMSTPHENLACVMDSTSPGAQDALKLLLHDILPKKDFVVLDDDEIAKFMKNRTAYHGAQQAITEWSTEAVGEKVAMWASSLLDRMPPLANGMNTTAEELDPKDPVCAQQIEVLNQLAAQFTYLENYNVSLESYAAIYQEVASRLPASILSTLCSRNMNMLMTSTLNQLPDLADQLMVPPTTMPDGGSEPPLPGKFSSQQTNAIMANAPLVLIRAGAGTGKTTTLNGRIQRLTTLGVDPSRITVVSFTNAAAEAIQGKTPGVHSMTISRMVMDIFNENYPGIDISDPVTLVNTLRTYYPKSRVASGISRLVLEINKGNATALTQLNTFIEGHFDEVMDMLRTIRQVTLEMQSIICYQKISQLKVPAHVQCDFLMVDEVQDNSIFDFVFILRFTARWKCNLLMVGDPSQTLYEFRFSNPKALNALESSGVFDTYNLVTNYRSNQEILDMANVGLNDIEANQYARIQLQSNNLQMPTEKSFLEKVHMEHLQVNTRELNKDPAEYVLTPDALEYISRSIAEGKQVAVMAYTRRVVFSVRDRLTELFPDAKIANMVSEEPFTSTVFSAFVSQYWDTIRVVDPAQATYVIEQQLLKVAPSMAKSDPQKFTNSVMRSYRDWYLANNQVISSWIQAVQGGSLTRDKFFDLLCRSLVEEEVRGNAIRRSVLRQKNEQRLQIQDAANADIVMSTVHGTKGLEYPRVLVLYNETYPMPEDAKRIYYVAFTRAMEELYISVQSPLDKPALVTQYQSLLHSLRQRDLAQAALDPQEVDAMLAETDDAEQADLDLARTIKAIEEHDSPAVALSNQTDEMGDDHQTAQLEQDSTDPQE